MKQISNIFDQEFSRHHNPTNCVNCGAPVRGYACEYCGTVYELSDLEQKKEDLQAEPRRIKFKISQQKQMDYILKSL